jgi:hypothetical protein
MLCICQTFDGKNVRSPTRRPQREREQYRHTKRDGGEDGFTWPRRTAVDLDNMARDAFMRIDDIHNDTMNEGNNEVPHIEEDDQWE